METPSEYRQRNRLPLLLVGLVGTLLFIMLPVFLMLCLSGLFWPVSLFIGLSVWAMFLACVVMSGSRER